MNQATQKRLGRCGSQQQDTATNRRRIVLAEDDKEMRALLSQVLHRAGYDVVECVDGLGLLDHLTDARLGGELGEIAVVISDIRMPVVTGLEILEGLHNRGDLPPVILITAFGDEKTHEEAERLGAAAIFDKPFEVDVLVHTVNKIVSLPRARWCRGCTPAASTETP